MSLFVVVIAYWAACECEAECRLYAAVRCLDDSSWCMIMDSWTRNLLSLHKFECICTVQRRICFVKLIYAFASLLIHLCELNGNKCWVVWHSVHSQQHTYMSSSYRSSRLGLSHWDPYVVRKGGCLELYYCNMVEWCWLDTSFIWKNNWFPLVLWYCWFGDMTCKNRPPYDL